MSEFKQLVEDFEAIDPITADDLMPFGVQVISLHDLRADFEKVYGTDAGTDFMDFVVFRRIPDDPGRLEVFLKEKTDYVSVTMLEKLKEALRGR